MLFLRLSMIFLLLTTINFAIAKDKPKNIIIMIGDGMGVSHITASRYVHGRSNFDRFKNLGLMTTHSRHSLVTDSAAGATALATGRKIRNKFVSFYKGKKFKTIMEYALESNMGTGLVVTSSITHATPAAFAAHVSHREQKRRIARQLARSGINLMIGGGRKYFYPSNTEDKKQKAGLLEEIAKRYKMIRHFSKLKGNEKEPYVFAIFTRKQLPRAKNRKFGLNQLTQFALDNLSQHENGFVIMIEGSQIDWASHKNDPEMIIEEVWDFDQAVGVALDYTKKRSDTLLVVTADHETGGYALLNGTAEKNLISEHRFATAKHTAEMVPLFSMGPGSEGLRGIIDNTQVGQLLIDMVKR